MPSFVDGKFPAIASGIGNKPKNRIGSVLFSIGDFKKKKNNKKKQKKKNKYS